MGNSLNDEIRREVPKLIRQVQALRDISPNLPVMHRLDDVARELDSILEVMEGLNDYIRRPPT
jgi:hypothetical protein